MTLELPREWTASEFREWLLTRVTLDRSALPVPSEMSVAVAVKKMFTAASADVRERLKSGVVQALEEWQHAAYGYAALCELCQIAGTVRATAAIPRLAEIIRRECASKRGDPLRPRAVKVAASHLTGFAPAADLEKWLLILFCDSAVDPALGGVLFVGLCKGRPDALSLHAAQFLKLREQAEHSFASIGAALLDAVPPVVLIPQFRMLPPEAREVIAHLLQPVADSEIEFRLDVSGIELVWIHQPAVKVPVSTSPLALAAAFAHATRHFDSANPNKALLRFINASD